MNDDIAFRTYRSKDLPALVALINDSDAVDRLERFTTLDDMGREMADPNYYPDTDCFLAWHDAPSPAGGKRLVGYADLFFRKGDEHSTFYTWGIVHPEWRRRGLGTRLMEAVIRRARERLSEVAHGPVYFQGNGYDRETDRRALFASLGMEPVRYFVNMARPLNGNLPLVELPAGYRLRRYDPERDIETVWRVINTAFRDHWGAADVPFEEFVEFRIKVPHFRPELVVVAEDETSGEMAGVCFNKIDPEWIAYTGRKEGYVGTLAVLRDARRRGLGTALLAETMHLLRREGMEGVHLHADAENVTGAVRIYERLGFAIRKNSVAYRKVLEAGE
jgi:mycothiol synthase